jgi:hypothetical protein
MPYSVQHCIALATVLVLTFGRTHAGQSFWSVANPEKTIALTLSLEGGRLSYRVDCIQKKIAVPVLDPSPMGISRGDQNFTSGLVFIGQSKIRTVEETYRMKIGKRLKIHARANECLFTFMNPGGAKLDVTVRAYADGVAFRYGFPDKSGRRMTVTGESTGFAVPSSGEAWMLPYSKVDTWAPAYEAEWLNRIPVGTPAPDSVGWSMPALFHANGRWILLLESGLDSTCFGVHLEPMAECGLYRVRLPETDETYGVATQEAVIDLPWTSAWRAVVMGETPATILETNMAYNLARPCALNDTSWIRPGRVSWSWWSDMSSPYNYQALVPFVDLASKLGWEYSLIDLGWHEMGNGGDVRKLIDYAESKNVGIILWYNSGGPHNRVPNACPCDIMHDPAKRKAEMEKIASWGVKGIKVDFMQSDKQIVIKLYHDILLDAARYRLMVDFHGATPPRGWARTLPNMLTIEAIRGAEQYWDVNFAENAHTFHTIYAFTRNVVGPMDYTPVIFGNAPNKIPHKTTNAHELATSVAFESGLQHFIDTPQSYLSQPEQVIDFLKTVPVVWDETKYIDGKPGELSVMARRHGQDWYIAGLNGEVKAKFVSVPLTFLGDGNYKCVLITDGKDPRSFECKTLQVEEDTVLSVELAERGGFTARIRLKRSF